MNWLKWIAIVVIVWLVFGGAIIWGTSKDVWNAGNSRYIPESK